MEIFADGMSPQVLMCPKGSDMIFPLAPLSPPRCSLTTTIDKATLSMSLHCLVCYTSKHDYIIKAIPQQYKRCQILALLFLLSSLLPFGLDQV
jgi:hypothetical protein